MFDRILVVDACDQSFIGDEQQRQTGCLVNAAAFGLDDAVFDLVAHAQPMTSANAVGFHDQRHQIAVLDAVQGDRPALFKAHRDFLACHGNFVPPEGYTHDRVDDFDTAAQLLQVLGFMCGTEHVGVC